MPARPGESSNVHDGRDVVEAQEGNELLQCAVAVTDGEDGHSLDHPTHPAGTIFDVSVADVDGAPAGAGRTRI